MGIIKQYMNLRFYLRMKYIKKEIMGLSLKKISGKKAKYEVVNLIKIVVDLY